MGTASKWHLFLCDKCLTCHCSLAGDWAKTHRTFAWKILLKACSETSRMWMRHLLTVYICHLLLFSTNKTTRHVTCPLLDTICFSWPSLHYIWGPQLSFLALDYSQTAETIIGDKHNTAHPKQTFIWVHQGNCPCVWEGCMGLRAAA